MNEATRLAPSNDIQQLMELEGKLRDKYKAEIAAKYGINEDQLGQIGVEGVIKGWSMQ